MNIFTKSYEVEEKREIKQGCVCSERGSIDGWSDRSVLGKSEMETNDQLWQRLKETAEKLRKSFFKEQKSQSFIH